MEERDLEMDDDGKIKIRKRNERNVLEGSSGETEDGSIIIDIPDFGAADEEDGENIAAEKAAEEAQRAAWEEQLRARKNKSLQIVEEAEKLYRAGEFDAAGEKFLDGATTYNGNWRAWFGVVRVHTKDLTDFSDVYECEQAYDKAFRYMPKTERAELSGKYVPALAARAEICAKERERFTAADVEEREGAREGIRRECSSAQKLFFAALALLAAFLVAGCVLAPLVNTVPDERFLIPCIVCFALAVAALGFFAVFARRFVRAKGALRKNLRAGTTEAGARAREFAEEEELIRSIIEDFTK